MYDAGSEVIYTYVRGNPISNVDPYGLASAADEARAMGLLPQQPYIPYSPRVTDQAKAYICKKLAAYGWNQNKAFVAAYNERMQEGWMNPTHEDGENWLDASSNWPWYDSYQNNYDAIVLYQNLKRWFPISKTPYSLPALEAGLDGRLHQSDTPADLKKWCHSCEQ
jgi:hypothetical protein